MKLSVPMLLQTLGPERGRHARTLLTHPRVQDLIQEGGNYIFVDRAISVPVRGQKGCRTQGKHISLIGLTRQLKQFYWPSYAPGRKTGNAQVRTVYRATARLRGLKEPKKLAERYQTSTAAAAGQTKPQGYTLPSESAVSHVRGSIVHRQLREWVLLDAANFGQLNVREHPSLLALLDSVAERVLCPIAVEYKVACTDPAVRLATGLDLVCVEGASGRPVYIELKTVDQLGLFFMDEPSVPFAAALHVLVERWNAAHPKAELKRSACTRAKVQLAMGLCMLHEGLGSILNHDWTAYVVVVPDDQARRVEWVPVTETFVQEVGIPLYQDLKAQIAQWRREKAPSKRKRELQEGEEELAGDEQARPSKRPQLDASF